MESTSSLNFPNMFDVSRNAVSVVEDIQSIGNRVRLLVLTEPTELYNNPQFGVGLKRHLWKYNNPNEVALIKDRIVAALRTNEPCVESEKTTVTNGLQFSGTEAIQATQEYNQLSITIAVVTKFGDTVEVKLNDNI